MTKHNYALENSENLAKGVGRSLGISLKHSMEIGSYIKGKTLLRSKAFLENVIEKKEAVPFRKFNADVGHKPGIGPGRYPIKAAGEILKLLKSIESNAQEKDMDVSTLYVCHFCANKASQPMRPGRHSRREAKKTHVEIALKENKNLKKEKKVKKSQKNPDEENKK